MNRQPHVKRNGQTMVEFALVIPLLIAGIFAIIVFGHLLVTYVLTGSASREGARYGSAVGAGNNGVPRYMDCLGMRQAAWRQLNLSGVPEEDVTITIGYDHGAPPSIATCPPPPDTVFLGDRVTVQVDITYHTIVPIPFIEIDEAWPITSNTGRSIIKDVAVGPAVPPPPPDVPSVYFTTEAQSIPEDGGNIQAILHLSEATDEMVTVSFGIGGSAGNPQDYTTTATGQVVIPVGSQEVGIPFTIVDDGIYEMPETIVIAITGAVNASVSNPNQQTLTIVDDDEPPTVSFVVGDSQFLEEDVLIPVVVQLDHASGSDVYVSVEVDGASTASVGTDYSIDTTTAIYFAAGDVEKYVEVTLKEDLFYEDSEVVILHLINPINATLGAIQTHNLVITDDDVPPIVSFDSPLQNVSEQTGMVTAGMHLNIASGLAVRVPFTISDESTATLGEDYIVSTVSPVEITAGALDSAIILTILDDGDDTEGSETIIFNLGTPENATLGVPSVHIITIQTLNVSFNTYGQQEPEDIGQMHVNLVLSEPWTEDVIVPFTFTGTATLDEDFTITASPVIIEAGDTSETIYIDVINDLLDENIESVIVTMGMPINAAPGEITEHTALIESDDNLPTVSFAIASQNKLEDNVVVNAILELTPASGRDVWVSFNTTGSSANYGSDYTISASPVIIPAGATTANIQVTLLEDSLFEGDEFVKIQLMNPVNANLGDITAHYVNIIEDDAPLCDISGMELEVESKNTGNPKYYRVTWTRIKNSSPYNLTLTQAQLIWPTGGGNNDPKLISAQWDLAKASGPLDWSGSEALSPYNITDWLSLPSERTINTGDPREWFMTFNLSRDLMAGNYTVTLVFRLTDFNVNCQPISRTTSWAP